MLWLVFAPFNSDTTLAAKPSRPTLDNFHEVFVERTDVPKSLGISVLLVIGTVTIVVLVGAPAAYALSRIRFPGRDTFLYLLLLLSSVVAGSAAILPLYLLLFELGLIDTYQGIWLAFAGGLLPAAMFILKDFTDSIPRSYEESARVFGASSFQALRHIVVPGDPPGARRDRRVDGGAGVGQLPRPVHPVRWPGQAPGRGVDVHVPGRGRRCRPRSTGSLRPRLHDPDPRALLVRQQALRVPLPRRDQALMPGIEIAALTKVFPNGVTALDGLDLSINDGEFFALLGPSGCGKTTLLRTIAGLEAATSGTIHIGTRDVTGLAARRPQSGDGVPGLRPVPAHDSARQHRLPVEDQARRPGRAQRRGRDPPAATCRSAT